MGKCAIFVDCYFYVLTVLSRVQVVIHCIVLYTVVYTGTKKKVDLLRLQGLLNIYGTFNCFYLVIYLFMYFNFSTEN